MKLLVDDVELPGRTVKALAWQATEMSPVIKRKEIMARCNH
jgi:hypothetical protein